MDCTKHRWWFSFSFGILITSCRGIWWTLKEINPTGSNPEIWEAISLVYFGCPPTDLRKFNSENPSPCSCYVAEPNPVANSGPTLFGGVEFSIIGVIYFVKNPGISPRLRHNCLHVSNLALLKHWAGACLIFYEWLHHS